MFSKLGMMVNTCNPQEGGNRQISEALWPVSLAYLLSPMPCLKMREMVSLCRTIVNVVPYMHKHTHVTYTDTHTDKLILNR